MLLRDHFHPPWSEENLWEGFHSACVNTLVRQLNGTLLPERFRALPQVRRGSSAEVSALHVHDNHGDSRLVAVAELVTPGNKGRAEERRVFAEKCAGYLRERVGVVLVDIVTTHHANLQNSLMEFISAGSVPIAEKGLCSVAYRISPGKNAWKAEIWHNVLRIGEALPTVPLWLAGTLPIPLDLESSYEETCRVLRMT